MGAGGDLGPVCRGIGLGWGPELTMGDMGSHRKEMKVIRPEGCVCGGLCSDTQQPFIIGSRAPRRKCAQSSVGPPGRGSCFPAPKDPVC